MHLSLISFLYCSQHFYFGRANFLFQSSVHILQYKTIFLKASSGTRKQSLGASNMASRQHSWSHKLYLVFLKISSLRSVVTSPLRWIWHWWTSNLPSPNSSKFLYLWITEPINHSQRSSAPSSGHRFWQDSTQAAYGRKKGKTFRKQNSMFDINFEEVY